MSRRERRQSQRLDMLERLQARREEASAAALGHVRRQYDEQRRRLDDLRGYRDEYRRRGLDSARIGVSMADLQRTRRFLDRLDDAIRQQEGLLERIREEIARHERLWRDAKGRRRGLQRLLDESLSRIRVHEQRREQRLLDELGGRHGRSPLD